MPAAWRWWTASSPEELPMATRGYNSYRGRTSAGKIVLIVVLVLVLLGAALIVGTILLLVGYAQTKPR